MLVLDASYGWSDRRWQTIPAITNTNHPLYDLRTLSGSKIALFGLPRRQTEGNGLNRRQSFKREILGLIHGIERTEPGLIYTTGSGGLMSKLSDDAKQWVLTANDTDTEDHTAAVLAAGMNSLYIWSHPAGIFTHNGLEYNTVVNSASLRQTIDTHYKNGVRYGNHMLPGWAHYSTPNNPDFDLNGMPLDPHLLSRVQDLTTLARSPLVSDISTSTTRIDIERRMPEFRERHKYINTSPIQYGYFRIGTEIIAFTSVRHVGSSNTRFTGVTRGVFGSTAAAHKKGDTVHSLKGYGTSSAFMWGAPAVRDMAVALGNAVNDTGLRFMSKDGIESRWYGPYGQLAANVYYKHFFDTLSSKEFSGEASRMWPYNWHFHDRFMWGERRTQVHEGTVFYQLANHGHDVA